MSDVQRGLPVSHGATILSEPHHDPALFARDGTAGAPATTQAARSLSAADDYSPASAVAADLRRRFHGGDRLRRVGAGTGRLQPD